jgi:cupin fold WbuC family metalloprotein
MITQTSADKTKSGKRLIRVRTITLTQINQLIYKARQNHRKRTIFRLHEHHEAVQRMVNAMIPGTYVQPHKHENPDKVELFSILKGHIAVLQFDARGTVTEVTHLEENGNTRIAEIPPRTYHTVLPLMPSAALEIVEGPYDPVTHKQPAAWAPPEDNAKAADYRMYLQSIVDNW